MTTEVIQDQSITKPRKRLLITCLVIAGLVIAWFGSNYLTRNSLYHQ